MARPKKAKPNRPDGRYEKKIVVGYKLDGTPIRRSFYSSKSIEDAQRKGNEYIVKMTLSGKAITAEAAIRNMTFEDVAGKVLEIQKVTCRESAYRTYCAAYKATVTVLGSRKIASITASDIENFCLSEKNYSISTIQYHVRFIKMTIRYAIDHDIITKNPFRSFNPAVINAGKKPEEKRTYTLEQLRKICQYCESHPSPIAIAVDIMSRYGATRSEVLGLLMSDFDFEKKTMHIQRGRTRQGAEIKYTELKTAYRNRKIPVSQKLIDLILKVQEQGKCDCVVHRDFAPYSDNDFNYDYDKIMKKISAELNIPRLNAHELRHSRATCWMEQGIEIYVIKKILGWVDDKMLMKVYGHPDTEKFRDVLDIDNE